MKHISEGGREFVRDLEERRGGGGGRVDDGEPGSKLNAVEMREIATLKKENRDRETIRAAIGLMNARAREGRKIAWSRAVHAVRPEWSLATARQKASVLKKTDLYAEVQASVAKELGARWEEVGRMELENYEKALRHFSMFLDYGPECDFRFDADARKLMVVLMKTLKEQRERGTTIINVGGISVGISVRPTDWVINQMGQPMHRATMDYLRDQGKDSRLVCRYTKDGVCGYGEQVRITNGAMEDSGGGGQAIPVERNFGKGDGATDAEIVEERSVDFPTVRGGGRGRSDSVGGFDETKQDDQL